MVLACPGLRVTRPAEDTQHLYCHKPTQESKPDLSPLPRWVHLCVLHHLGGASRQASGPLQKCRWGPHLGTQGEVFCSPAPHQVANDQGRRIRP